ncbi:MAG: penicillin-binding transpeptidase domain-containing protein [Thermodesulfobacteriota bacterium]
MEPINLENTHWRKYQQRLQRAGARKSLWKTATKYFLLCALLILFVYGIDRRLGDATGYPDRNTVSLESGESKASVQPDPLELGKNELRALLDAARFTNLKEKSFDYIAAGKTLRIETSLDISLQQYLQEQLSPVTSRYIGIVVMDPATGKVLSMAGYDKDAPESNPCVDSKFPAASVFKIITAAAAIEKLNVVPASEFTYNGGKHTLYKSQLREKTNRYTRRITLADSFAQSVNPVFGKLGANYLGGTVLEEYAGAFGFNHPIEFEIPVVASTAHFSDEPYQWAEIASGFNHKTTMSPLHGAMLTAAIINGGKLMEPTIVDQVTDESGKVIYRSRPKTVNQAISPQASEKMNSLMEATITSGTAKKIFRGYQRDRVLSRLHMGGKTGSIDNKVGDARFDWFVGYAEEKGGDQKIVISAVVAHEKYIGIRSAEYARMAIKHYFKDYFTKNKTKTNSEHRS